MANIDELNIEISGSATKAEKALDKLISRLDVLSQSLGKVNGSNVTAFSNSLKTLSDAMAKFKETKVTASTFNSIASGINKFAEIDATKISQVGSALTVLSTNLQSISGVSVNVQGLTDFSTAINKFGGKMATQATANLPKIGNDLKQFVTDMNGIQNVSFDVSSLALLIQSLTRLGYKTVTQATQNLPNISRDLKQFITDLNSIGSLSFDMTNLTSLVSAISKLGGSASGSAVTNIPNLAQALKDLFATLATAPNVSQNIIDMTNALANLARTGSSAGRAARTLNSSLNSYSSSANAATKSTKGIASAIGKFYATFFLLIRCVKAFGKAVKSTSDYIEALNYFNVAFNKVGTDWGNQFAKYGYENAESYAKSFTDRMSADMSKLSGITFDTNNMRLANNEMKNLGLNIQEVTQYAAELAGVLNSANLTGEATYAASNALTKLAGDYSSLINVDYKTAAQNFRSGITGQSEVLYKYGIDVTDARLKTEAYALGIQKSVSEMTQAEKMQLRLIAILKQSKVAWGDLANTINQPANQMRVLKTQVQELSMMFGQLFVPVLSKVIPVITGVVIALKRLMSAIAGFMGIKLGDKKDFTPDFSGISAGAEDVSSGLDDVAKSAKKAKAGLRGFDELNVINMPDTSSSGAIGGGGGALDLTDEILAATSEYEKVWQEAFDNMQSIAEQWADKIGVVFKPLQDMFQNISLGNYEQAGENFSDFWINIFDSIANAIDNVNWYDIGHKIGEFLAGIDWFGLLKSVGNLIWQAIKSSIEWAAGVYDAAPLEYTILAGIALLKWTGAGKLIVKGIKTAILAKLGEITAIFTKGGFFTNIGLVIENLFSGLTLKDSMIGVFGKLGTKIAGIGTILVGVTTAVGNFFSMWRDGFSWVKEAFMLLGITLSGLGAVILGVSAATVAPIAAIIAGVSTIAILIHDNWDTIKNTLSNVGDWFNKNIISPVLTAFKTLGVGIKDFFVNAWEGVKSVWSAVSGWFNNYVIQPVEGFFKWLWESVSGYFKRLWEDIKFVWNAGPAWFKSTVIDPVFNFFKGLYENVSGFFRDLWDGIKNVWSAVSGWFSSNIISPVSNAFTTMGNTILNVFTAVWTGIKRGLSTSINAVIGGIEKGINFIINALNFLIKGLNKVISSAGNIIGQNWRGVSLIQNVSLGRIPTYAAGGYPKSADLFYANENGIPELVGTMGGKTAVASGMEITGISDAVYSTGQTEASLLKTAVGLLEVIAEKEYGISSDTLFKSVQKSARTYTQRTGRTAFA